MKATLSDADFGRLRTLLHDMAGLVFDETRRDSLAYALGERLPASGCPDVASYLDLLSGPEGQPERQGLIDEVTIPETYFFRNPPQIRALRREVLPELVTAAATSRRLVVWSAGCSTGEEPYTVAMILQDLLPEDAAGWDVRVVATDVSQRALGAARRGRYGQRALQHADAETRARWFQPADGDWVVKPELARLVQFRHHNLVTDPAPFLAGEVDLILCRNVTIYFDRETTRALMGRFHRSLREGGYLFLGHAETLWQITEDFRLVTLDDAFVYRRIADRRPVRDLRTSVLGALPRALGLPFGRRHVDDPAPAPTPGGAPAGTPRDGPGLRPALPAEPSRLAAPAVAPPPIEPTLALVSAELRAGRYAVAAELAAGVSARDPLRAEPHYLRGMALCNLGQDRDALVNLRKAVYLDPDAGFAHFLLAGALARLGERVAAARSYRAAAETLGRRAGDAAAAELGGRSVAELIALCRTLAGSEERKASTGGRR